MKKLWCILLLCMGINTHAQQYFNVRNSLHSFNSILTSVVEDNHKYYTAGICLDSINYIGGGTGYIIWGIKFAVFDKNGNELLDTFYQRQDIDIYTWDSKLIKQSDNSFLLAAYATDTSQYYLMLYRFDTLGRVLMEKQYHKPVCSTANSAFWRLKDFKPDGNGNWLMLSTIKCNSNHDLFLTKLDSAFNVIWHKQYGDNVLNDIAGRILVDGNSYVISGGRTNNNLTSKNFIYRAELIKIDTAGNVQWTYLSPASRLTNAIQDVIKTQDGGYVYCGQGDATEYLAPDGVTGVVSFRAWVEKIDGNRNVVWSKGMGKYFYNTQFTNIQEDANGNLRLFGSHYDYDSLGVDSFMLHTRGWYVLLKANGDSIKERLYSYLNTCNDEHFVYDAKPTSDGGYIMAGESKDNCYPYTPPTQRAWLIKVDSNGCMSPTDPQCHPTGTNKDPELLTVIQLYPNPVNSTLYINNTHKEPLSITIYDLMGRVVQEQQLHSGMNEMRLPVLPAGVYVYKLTDGRSVVQQGKLVKE